MVLTHKNHEIDPQISKHHGLISQERIPQAMVGRKYLDLFQKMLLNGKLCIALYRKDDRGSEQGVWYVSLNPNQNTILESADAVFILTEGLIK